MDNLEKIYNLTDDKTKSEFTDNIDSKLMVDESIKKVQFDYSWLDKIEECIPYLDIIIRNPKKFIQQEEEIVNVEKAKKLTQESVVHLATHTNFIQKYDAVEETITPSKVLNINKEESFDIYENRFIYSLLMNLSMFIARRKNLVGESSSNNQLRKYNYSAKTVVGHEKVNFSFGMEKHLYEDLNVNSSGETASERLNKIQLIIADFMHSVFFNELASGNIVMVKSPIRKTNVILKNINFQKALELWEFIERYNVNDKEEVNENNNYEITGEIKEMADKSFLLDYLLLNAKDTAENKNSSGKEYILSKIVKDYIDETDEINETKFKIILNKEFNVAYKDRIKRENKIKKIISNYFKKYNKDIKPLIK